MLSAEFNSEVKMSGFISGLSNAFGSSSGSFGEGLGSFFGSGLISGVQNLIQGGSTRRQQNRAFKHNQKLQEQQYQYNQALAQQAYDWQNDFWQMQQEYNTPANQRARLEEAGLNPALIYGAGQGANVAGGLSSTPQASVGTPSTSGGVAPVIPLNPLTASQVELNRAQANKLNQESETEPFRRELLSSQSSLLQLQGEGQDVANQLAQINLYIEGKTADVKVNTAIANLDSVISTVARTNAETDVALATKELRVAEVGATYAMTALRMAQTDLAKANVKVSKAQAQLYLSEVKRNLIENIRDVQLVKESQARERYIDRKRTNETVTTYVNLYDRVILGTADKVLGALGHVVKKALSQSTVELNKQLSKRAAKIGTEHYDGQGGLLGVDLDVW